MAAAGWFLALAVALAAGALSSRCTTTAVARPSLYTGSSSSSSLDCGTVTSVLAGCAGFVKHGAAASSLLPAPGTPCCEGVAELYAVAADSADNWRSVCGCMAGLVRRYSSNASAIALLPVVCGVLPTGFKVDTLTYCRRCVRACTTRIHLSKWMVTLALILIIIFRSVRCSCSPP
ncbi:putative non-specific lipid-transfer protein 14 [Phragmites australis]|uniref:putative non-specific lipid-transfer protein 14 n=1 Tax=Phragmites australis TaxID=29695 RepID=UPI002D778AAD|nr:putative non-specific lipid-transfer protein 14 [Phragmites australis]